MKCKRNGCSNEVTQKNMTYCCRECAPYGNYGIEEKPSPNQYIREKSQRMPETRPTEKPKGMSDVMWKALK